MNGLCIQWGNTSVAAGAVTSIYFPLQPIYNYTISYGLEAQYDGTHRYPHFISRKEATYFEFYLDGWSDVSYKLDWVLVGYV